MALMYALIAWAAIPLLAGAQTVPPGGLLVTVDGGNAPQAIAFTTKPTPSAWVVNANFINYEDVIQIDLVSKQILSVPITFAGFQGRTVAEAVDRKNNLIWFSDKGHGNIVALNASNSPATNIVATVALGNSTQPVSVATDSSGTVWTALAGASQLARATASNGVIRRIALSDISGASVVPVHVVVDPWDTVWVSAEQSSGTNAVLFAVNSTTGALKKYTFSNVQVYGSMAADADGYIYFFCQGISSQTYFLYKLSQNGSVAAQFPLNVPANSAAMVPFDISLDSVGTLWLMDSQCGVTRMARNGTVLGFSLASATCGISYGIGVAPDQTVWVTDVIQNIIYVLAGSLGSVVPVTLAPTPPQQGQCSTFDQLNAAIVQCYNNEAITSAPTIMGATLPPVVYSSFDAACAYVMSQVVMISTEINVCTVASGCPTSLCVHACNNGVLESSMAVFGLYAGESDFNYFVSYYVYLFTGISGDCSPYLYCSDVCNYLPTTAAPTLPTTSRPSARPSSSRPSARPQSFAPVSPTLSKAPSSSSSVQPTSASPTTPEPTTSSPTQPPASAGAGAGLIAFVVLALGAGVGFLLYRRGLCSRRGMRGLFARWFGTGEHTPMTGWEHSTTTL